MISYFLLNIGILFIKYLSCLLKLKNKVCILDFNQTVGLYLFDNLSYSISLYFEFNVNNLLYNVITFVSQLLFWVLKSKYN